MSAPSPSMGGCNLFVANLPPGTNDERLYTLFAPFGKIVSSKVMVDLRTKMLRNHGFVRFAQPDEAASAIATLHKRRVDENYPAIHVTLSTHRDDDRTNECEVVYVRNLPDGTSADKLRHVFSQYGAITDILIPSGNTGHHAVGFVKYANVEDARNAVRQAHNSTPFGGARALQVRFKESKQMSKDRGAAKTTKNGTASPNSGQTSPAYSPDQNSLSAMATPAGLSLALSPGNQQLPQGFVLMPLQQQQPGGSASASPQGQTMSHTTISPAGQPLPAMHNQQQPASANQSPTGAQNFQPVATPPPFGMPAMQLPGAPQQHQQQQQQQSGSQMFSLAASSQPPPMASISLQPTDTVMGFSGQHQQQQHHHQQTQQQPQQQQQQRTFPGANDLFFSNFGNQEWLIDLLKPWQPALIQPGPGTLIVRLRDESMHMTAAQNLNGMFGPTGTQLTAALVRV